jgi:hypothetical protein
MMPWPQWPQKIATSWLDLDPKTWMQTAKKQEHWQHILEPY